MSSTPSFDHVPMDWVGDWSGSRARLTPAREALVDGETGRRWSYADLDDRANRVANWLTGVCGLRAGDRVAFLARNRIEPIDLYMACGKVGLVLAPLSYRLSARELTTLAAQIEPRVVFVEDCFRELSEAIDWPQSLNRRVYFGETADQAYQREVLAAPATSANRAVALEAPFLYVHTGGSTGTPKVCVVPHRQMVWNSVELLVAAPEGLAGRRELVFFPLFHIGGWNTVTPIFHAGGRVVLVRQFEPARALAVLQREKINHFGAVEAILDALSSAEGFAGADLSALQAITTAAAPCSQRAMRPFWSRGIAVAQSYGQTEAGPSNFVNSRLGKDDAELQTHWQSIGTACFHCDYRIVAPGTGARRPLGEAGELWLRSPHGFAGYLGDAERTARTITEDGWVHTGDLAREDTAGYVTIVGRTDNMLISGGENVAPEEVEAVLGEYSGIRQVVVFGVPDERWGQVGMAVLVPENAAPEPEALKAWLGERLAAYKRPRYFTVTDTLPLTAAGKIDRLEARRRFFEARQGAALHDD